VPRAGRGAGLFVDAAGSPGQSLNLVRSAPPSTLRQWIVKNWSDGSTGTPPAPRLQESAPRARKRWVEEACIRHRIRAAPGRRAAPIAALSDREDPDAAARDQVAERNQRYRADSREEKRKSARERTWGKAADRHRHAKWPPLLTARPCTRLTSCRSRMPGLVNH